MRTSNAAALAALALAVFAAAPAPAQTAAYPSRAIRFVLPFPPALATISAPAAISAPKSSPRRRRMVTPS